MSGHRIDVVVPAHDEETTIGRSLAALAVAVRIVRRAHPAIAVGVTLVLDGCTDGTAAAVDAAVRTDRTWADGTLAVHTSDRVGVGRARALGVLLARRRAAADVPPSGHWFAHTDADSRVHRDWLVQQADVLVDGGHLLVGAVVPDPDDLGLGCSVDGETVQDARTSDLVFPVPLLIAELSAVLPLLPGDVIFTGTPAGVGMSRQPPRALAPGQVLESWVEGVGTIRNRCV